MHCDWVNCTLCELSLNQAVTHTLPHAPSSLPGRPCDFCSLQTLRAPFLAVGAKLASPGTCRRLQGGLHCLSRPFVMLSLQRSPPRLKVAEGSDAGQATAGLPHLVLDVHLCKQPDNMSEHGMKTELPGLLAQGPTEADVLLLGLCPPFLLSRVEQGGGTSSGAMSSRARSHAETHAVGFWGPGRLLELQL